VIRVLVMLLTLASGRLCAQTTDSLVSAAQRAARAWRAHDFGALLAGSREISLHLPGADPSQPVRAAQATELLRTFAGQSQELELEVEVARHVDSSRAYVEMHRTYQMRPGAEQRAETLYLGLRREGLAYRVSEIRIVR
jgi:hypothetical protein